ncbi:MAG: PAS domain S-box protein, partial [Mycobacteriaceae bacterium]
NQILGEFADIVSIALVDESGEAMDQVVVRHRDRIADADMARLGQIKIVRGHGLSGKVWQSGQPLRLNDLDAAPAQQEGWLREAQPFVDHYGVRSLLYLPLRSHGEITGGLSLTRVAPHGNFTPDEVALFTDVAEICGLAITNARLHEQLAAREAEFRVLAENASDVVFRADQDRRITWISPTVTGVLGWTPEELLGTRMSDLWRPEAWAATEADRAAVYAGQAPPASGGYLFELRTKSGEYRWMSGRAKPVTDDAGNPSGVVSGVRDVHELVTAREALRKSTEQYRLLAENAADVVVRTAGDSKREWVSDSVQAVLGWTPPEFLSLSDEQLLHPDDLADLMRRRAALNARSGPEVSHSEFRVRAADGRMMWLSSRTRRLADGSRITALRAINREVEMRAALQQSNRDLEAFASAAAHDLRAPLRHLNTYTSFLLETLDVATLTSEQRRYATIISQATERMAALINDLLAFSRVAQPSDSDGEVHSTALQQEVDAIKELLSGELQSTGTTLTCTAAVDVLMDPARLRQVLQNLIQNAITHRAPNRPQRIIVTGHLRRDGYVEVAVSDDGPGVAPEFQTHIFAVFKQLDKGRGGTGLGLPIAKRIVEGNGGTIWVDSDGHRGAVFAFTVPHTSAARTP